VAGDVLGEGVHVVVLPRIRSATPLIAVVVSDAAKAPTGEQRFRAIKHVVAKEQ
jgi:hypothetical protein